MLVYISCRLIRHLREARNSCRCNNNNNSNELLSINSNCGNIEDGNLLTISSCGCNQDSDTALNNGLSARINVIPNSNNNGRTGNVCGCYRRR